MIATGFSPAAGLALVAAGVLLAVAGERRLGWLAGLLPLPVLWLVGAGLAQFPLFPIQRPWPATMWLLVLLVPVAYALGAAVAVAAVRARAPHGGRPALAAAATKLRLRPLLLALLLLGLVELGHQFAGAGGIPLLSGNIDATRFAQPRGPTVLLVDLLVVVAVVALVRPPRLSDRAWRFELGLGLVAIGALALQASRGSLLLPLATVAVARAMTWGIPRRRTLIGIALVAVVAFCGLFYARVAQHPDRAFEHDLLHRVVPSRPLWERPFLPVYIALAPNFEVVRGLVTHFPTAEPFAHGAFSTVAFNRVLPGTRLTGEISARITPPFTAPTFAGSLWADGGLVLVWIGAALLGALNGALLTLAGASGALRWRLTAAYAVVLTTFAIYDSFFTQYVDWLVIGPALLLVGGLAGRRRTRRRPRTPPPSRRARVPERASRAGGDAALVFLSRAVAAVAFVGLTPFIVAELGKSAYGVWIVVSAATGLVGLVDVGIGPAVSRVVAAAAARGDARVIRSTVLTALLASLALDVPLLAAGWALAPALADLLDVPPTLHEAVRDALRLAFAAFVLTTFTAVWEGVLVGRQRFRALLAVRVAYVLAFTAGAIVTLRGGHGVVGLAASQVGGMALALALGALACCRVLRRAGGAGPSRASLRQLLRYGLPQQSSRIAYAGAMHYERLLVGVVCGAGIAAEYGAASTVVASLASLLAQSTVVLIPRLTRVHVQRPDALGEAFTHALGSVSVVAAGVLGMLAASAAPLVAGWLGAGFEPTARLIQILAVGFAMWVIAHPGFALVQSLGRPSLELRAAGVVVLVNAVATSVLVGVFGAHALALGTSAALTLGALAFWRVAGRHVPDRAGWRRTSLAPLLPAAALAAAISTCNELFVPIASLDRPAALALAGGEALLFAALYAGVLVRVGVLAVPTPGALLRPRRRAAAADAEAA